MSTAEPSRSPPRPGRPGDPSPQAPTARSEAPRAGRAPPPRPELPPPRPGAGGLRVPPPPPPPLAPARRRGERDDRPSALSGRSCEPLPHRPWVPALGDPFSQLRGSCRRTKSPRPAHRSWQPEPPRDPPCAAGARLGWARPGGSQRAAWARSPGRGGALLASGALFMA